MHALCAASLVCLMHIKHTSRPSNNLGMVVRLKDHEATSGHRSPCRAQASYIKTEIGADRQSASSGHMSQKGMPM